MSMVPGASLGDGYIRSVSGHTYGQSLFAGALSLLHWTDTGVSVVCKALCPLGAGSAAVNKTVRASALGSLLFLRSWGD